jgi:hypothetical protein
MLHRTAPKAPPSRQLHGIDAYGASVIQADEYDAIPELTDADLARGTCKISGKAVGLSEGKATLMQP